MKLFSVGGAVGVVVLFAWSLGDAVPLAQAPPAPQLPRGQVPDRGRPTKADDEVPLFDFERYFVGKWTFEWDVPDSPFGPSGTVKGVEVVKPGVEGKFYDADYEGEGPAGKFTGRARMIYLRDNKSVVRYETDSRGYSLLKAGPIGGDLGGYYTIYYETGPFTHNGHVINLRTTTVLLSPVNYRVRAQISVDGGPFTNFGNPWYRKQVSPASGAPGDPM